MNKGKLLELSDTLRSIAEGKEWEYESISGFMQSCSHQDPLKLVSSGCKIRIKPQLQPDPYAELKAAHAAGKTIQFLSGGVAWRDCDGPPLYFSNLEYRIKPEPQKLPLCADDVKAGAQFLSKCGQVWFPNHIREGYVCFGHFMSLTFQELIDDGWKIRCAGETDWHPCYKLVEQ